jgi:hypothetical protein
MPFNEDPYMEFVKEKANEIGKIFILDSGEGNGFIEPETGWYIEELSGWLINPADKEKLIKLIRTPRGSKEHKTAYVDFSDSYVFVEWSKSKNGNLEIVFKKY